MTNDDARHDDGTLAEVIAFPGTKAAPAPREHALAQLRAQIAETEAEHAPHHAAVAGAAGRSEHPGDSGAERGEVSSIPEATSSTEREDAEDLLVRALARGPKSVKEAEHYLAEHAQLDRFEREHVINRMLELNYLDDTRLAEQLIAGRLGRKGLGRGGMERELGARGIDRDTVADVLADIDTDDEFARALALAQDRAGKLRGLDRETAKRRLYGYLSRRGYGGDVVGRAVREALG